MNDNIQNAYTAIINLQFEKGQSFIQLEKEQNPNNGLIHLNENYKDFLALIIGEDKQLFDEISANKSKRLSVISTCDKNSPYYLYSQAEINLQWAFARLKFQEYFLAAYEIQKAYFLLEENQEKFIVVIDAGHGGDDPGAKGPSGVYEKNVVLKIAKNLAEVINKERGMRAVLIRKGDYYIKLRNRIEKAREYKADLFISIHADAFRDPKVRGSSVYVLSKKGASSEAAKWLAEKENSSDLIGGVSLENKDDLVASVLLDLSQTASLEASIDIADRILKGLRKVGKVHKRNVQSAPFAVLKSPDIPSMLIETAVISNPIEEKKLTNSKHRKKMSNAILIGLKGYFRDFAPEDSLLSSRKHTIERGETLSTIAQLYRISPNMLRKYNSLKGDLVRAGQTIIIPRNSGT